MEEYIKTFAERLYSIRMEKNLTMQQVADDLKTGTSTLSQYENCQREPKLGILLKLSKYFDVDVNWLIGYSNIRKVDACGETKKS
jgi:transcriptional regulator with XRE-family HTH domain